MSDREVHERCPQRGEDQPRAELRAVGYGTGDETHGETGEHRLEGHEDHGRDTGVRVIHHEPLESKELRDVAQETRGAVRPSKDHRVAEKYPQDAHDKEGAHDHHHHVENGLDSDHAPIKEGQSGDHEQDERGCHEHPGCISCVER